MLLHITKFDHRQTQADKQHNENKNTTREEIYGHHFFPCSNAANLK